MRRRSECSLGLSWDVSHGIEDRLDTEEVMDPDHADYDQSLDNDKIITTMRAHLALLSVFW